MFSVVFSTSAMICIIEYMLQAIVIVGSISPTSPSISNDQTGHLRYLCPKIEQNGSRLPILFCQQTVGQLTNAERQENKGNKDDQIAGVANVVKNIEKNKLKTWNNTGLEIICF